MAAVSHDLVLWHALYDLEVRYWHEVDGNGGANAHSFYTTDGVFDPVPAGGVSPKGRWYGLVALNYEAQKDDAYWTLPTSADVPISLRRQLQGVAETSSTDEGTCIRVVIPGPPPAPPASPPAKETNA